MGTRPFGSTRDRGWARKVVKHLDHYLISEQVEIADRTAEFAHFYLSGPEVYSLHVTVPVTKR